LQLLLGVETGVIIGICLSLLNVIQHSSHPRLTRVGRLALPADQSFDGTEYRDLVRFPAVR
jgi:MFS superfamily sulfate permease-like transporter